MEDAFSDCAPRLCPDLLAVIKLGLQIIKAIRKTPSAIVLRLAFAMSMLFG